MINNKLIVSSSPHVRSNETIEKIMLDVVIALMPALVAGTLFFGLRAVTITLVSIFSCIAAEYIWQRACNNTITIGDWSAVVTGMLLAFNLPVTVPLWIPVVGGFFAIIIAKQLFGGLGQNFINPALAARAFLLASWPALMTKWVMPFTDMPIFGAVDVISSATPLDLMKGVRMSQSLVSGATSLVSGASSNGAEVAQALPTYFNMFIGNIGGCIGETSALALIIGGIYLLWRRVINWRIPVSFIITVAVMTFIFGNDGLFTGDALYHILSGGLILGAFFMATDYASSPVTRKGQIIMGIGCGIITTAIRLYGGYPEGVSYSILLMNIVTPLIDRYITPVTFGGGKAHA